MELYAAEAAAIKKQVTNWLTHPDYELESTFGKSGQVGAVQFLAIAQRLKAKGLYCPPARGSSNSDHPGACAVHFDEPRGLSLIHISEPTRPY